MSAPQGILLYNSSPFLSSQAQINVSASSGLARTLFMTFCQSASHCVLTWHLFSMCLLRKRASELSLGVSYKDPNLIR